MVKMNILFSGAFWGVVIIIFGISILIKVLFNIDIPVLRIIFGIIIIFVGVSLVTGKSFIQSDNGRILFSEGKINASADNNDYSVIFGKGVIHLEELQNNPGKNSIVRIHTVFGENTIRYNSSLPVEFKTNVVFGSATIPGRNISGFGNHDYESPAGSPDPGNNKLLKVELNVVFGSLTVESSK